MSRAGLRGLAGRMKWITQAHQPAYAGLIGDHARNPAAEGLAADHEKLSAAEFVDRVAPGLHQHRSRIWRSALAGFAPSSHVWKFESRDADAGLRDPLGDRFHEGRIHRTSRTVRENQSSPRGLRSVEQKLGHGARSSDD